MLFRRRILRSIDDDGQFRHNPSVHLLKKDFPRRVYQTPRGGASHHHVTYQENTGRIALLKIDVEGFEIDVLKGATDLFRECLPAIVMYEVSCENSKRLGRDPDASTAFLLRQGYSIRGIGPDGLLVPLGTSDATAGALDNWIARYDGGTARPPTAAVYKTE